MSTLTSELTSFIDQSNELVAKIQPVAAALPANTVQVWPGGAKFNTIQAAIDSVANAGPQLQYQIAVGPGTYNENVVMKDYIYIIGADQDITVITAPAQLNATAGVVNSSSGAGISELTINAPGGSWGTWPIGIKICGSGKFHISGVNINSGGDAIGDNARGISNNTGSYTGNVVVSQSNIMVTGASSTTCIGAELFGMDGLTVFFNLTAIQCNGSGGNLGVSTAAGATATLNDCKIISNNWALYNSDQTSPITANQCTINGPVSAGVVVNN